MIDFISDLFFRFFSDYLSILDTIIIFLIFVIGACTCFYCGKKKPIEKKIAKKQIIITVITLFIITLYLSVKLCIFLPDYSFKNTDGILILNITGDDTNNSFQRHLKDTLDTTLNEDYIEVHRINKNVDTQPSSKKQHQEARFIGRKYNAKIVLWGELIGENTEKKFHPRITIVDTTNKAIGDPEKNIAVQNIINFDLPPILIDTPIYLTHCVAGFIQYDKKDYRDALVRFQKAIEYLPDDPPNIFNVLFFIANCHVFLSELSEEDIGIEDHLLKAKNIFSVIINSADIENKKRTHNNLGSVYRRIGQKDSSEIHYRSALKIDPYDVPTNYNFGQLLRETGNPDSAIVYYERALERYPEYSDAYNILGVIYSEKGNYSKGLDYFELAKKYNPGLLGLDHNFAVAYLIKGIEYFNNGNINEGIRYTELALEYEPENDDIHSNLGVMYRKKGDIEKGNDHNKLAFKYNPYNTIALQNLGTYYSKKGEYEIAQGYWEKLLEIEPNNTTALNNLGVCYFNKEEYIKAQENFEKLIKIQSDHIAANYNLSEIHFIYSQKNAKNIEEEISELKLAEKYNKNNIEALYNLGICYLNKEEYENAQNYFKKVINLNPEFPESYYSLGLINAKEGDIETAKEHYKKAIELNPKYSQAHNNLGLIYLNEGNSEEAKNEFLSIIEYQIDYAMAYNNLGIIYEIQDDKNKAIDSYQLFLKYWNGDNEMKLYIENKIKLLSN